MVAEDDCTTSVIPAPKITPRTGISFTLSIISKKNGAVANGFMTVPMISMPSNNNPNENIAKPIFFIFSFLQMKFIINPANIIG